MSAERVFTFFFILTSAVVSSIAQLAFSDSTGIGLSGIGYALFGYLLIKRKTDERYKDFLDNSTINLFLFWLALCVVLTKTGSWTVGNAAHIGGLLWGILVAYTSRFKTVTQWASRFAFVFILTSLIFLNPLSTSYLTYRAYEFQSTKRFTEARNVYQEILNRDPDNQVAIENIKIIDIYELSKKASELHSKSQFTRARQVYKQILEIDKENAWAKSNLSMLPKEK